MITQKYSSNGEIYYLKIMITSKYNLRQFRSLIEKNPKTIVLESGDLWLNPKTMSFANILLENNYKPDEPEFLNKRNPKDTYLLKPTLTAIKQ